MTTVLFFEKAFTHGKNGFAEVSKNLVRSGNNFV